MARPRKDSEAAGARRRIIDAFWTLLETAPLSKITIGAVAAQAGCNRGTFYYHFDGMEALIRAAIQEVMDDKLLIHIAFLFSADADGAMNALDRYIEQNAEAFDRRVEHFALIMRAGEMHTVDVMAKQVILERWQAALCPEGGELSQDARLVIETTAGGILSFIAYECRTVDRITPPTGAAGAFLTESAQNALRWVAVAQGLDEEEAIRRLMAYDSEQERLQESLLSADAQPAADAQPPADGVRCSSAA